MDNTCTKTKLALELVNDILETINKPSINTLEDFKDIDRELLITDQVLQMITKYEPKFFGPFSKIKLKYYHKNIHKNYQLSFLRGMAQELDYKLGSKTYKKQENTVVKTTQLYSFEKK